MATTTPLTQTLFPPADATGASAPTNLTPPSGGRILSATPPPRTQLNMSTTIPLTQTLSPPADATSTAIGGEGGIRGVSITGGTVATSLPALAPAALALPGTSLTCPAAAQALLEADAGTDMAAHTTIAPTDITGPAAVLPHRSPVPLHFLHGSAERSAEVSTLTLTNSFCPHMHHHCSNHS